MLNHATIAMDILDKDYSHEDHVLVFDNALTHCARETDALSARNMLKGPSASIESNWGVTVDQRDENNNLVYKTVSGRSKVAKIRVRMDSATFADGTPQQLYFPPSHEKAGLLKGMSVLLQERGVANAPQLKAQCRKSFNCTPDATNCCCRRILYTQPDFVNIPSILETHCKWCGCRVIFLPKFHCELNFIEQCWGYSKRLYCQFPTSSQEADLERNVTNALDAVPLLVMRW